MPTDFEIAFANARKQDLHSLVLMGAIFNPTKEELLYYYNSLRK